MSNIDKVVTPVSPQRVQDNHSGPSPVSVTNIPSTTVTKVAPVVEVGDHVGVGIDIAMSYANDVDQTPEAALKLLAEVTNDMPMDCTGLTTIDKRNRIKRVVKVLSPQKKITKLLVGEKVKEFYSKYLRNIFFEAKDLPVVVDINTYTVKYDKFYNSFKAIGEIDDEFMSAYT